MIEDEPISRSIANRMKTPSSVVGIRMGVCDVISVMSAADLCIGMRLHSLIYSVIGNVPLIGISYDPKIKGFMDYINQKLCLDMSEVLTQKGYDTVDALFRNYDDIKLDMESEYVKLKEKARENGKIAVELYEKGSVKLEK